MGAIILVIVAVYSYSWLFMYFLYDIYGRDAIRRGDLNPIVARLFIIIAPVTLVCVAIGLVGWMIGWAMWEGVKWFFNIKAKK